MADGYKYHSNRLVMIIPVYHMSIECGLITGHLVWWVISWHSTSETREPSWLSHETIHHFGHPHGKILGPWHVEIHVVHSRSQMWTGKTSSTAKKLCKSQICHFRSQNQWKQPSRLIRPGFHVGMFSATTMCMAETWNYQWTHKIVLFVTYPSFIRSCLFILDDTQKGGRSHRPRRSKTPKPGDVHRDPNVPNPSAQHVAAPGPISAQKLDPHHRPETQIKNKASSHPRCVM